MHRIPDARVKESRSDDRYRPGQIVAGKYELRRRIGEGAMGTVWMGCNTALDADVAIKLVKVHGNRMQAERLVQEARAAARLIHPSIVRLYDFGMTEQGDPYIVMELVVGDELAEVMNREGRIGAVRAVQTMLPIADALATAHGKGIVHRDFKPENVMLARDEKNRIRPKLLDFGIAKLQSVRKRRITLAGAVVGTPDYMAPEQASGQGQVDHRTDIWAFSVVLYELVVGRRPFRASNYHDLLRAIVDHEPQPITELQAGDAALWQVIRTGLHKDPEERWDSMHALGEALALWLYERGVREDICATSLKTSWLRAGLSGVKIDVPPSVPPGPGSAAALRELLPPPLPSGRASRPNADVIDEPGPGAAVIPTGGGTIQRVSRASRVGKALALCLLGTTSALVIGLAVTARAPTSTSSASHASPNPIPVDLESAVEASGAPGAKAPSPHAMAPGQATAADPIPTNAAGDPSSADPSAANSADAGAEAPATTGSAASKPDSPYIWPPPSVHDRVKAWKKPGLAPADYEFGF